MEYIKNTLEFHIDVPTAVTLGKFDGFHRGHQLLADCLMEECAADGLKSVVFTFDIPPRNLLEDTHIQQLLTKEEKIAHFRQKGVDYLIECPFTPEVRTMEPEKFVDWMVNGLNVNCFVIGDDFRFGRDRRGDGAFLRSHEERYGYHTVIVPKMKDGSDVISSSLVRKEIAEGNIARANQLLGYDYYIRGTVVHGNRLGHEIGFPTVNILPPGDKVLPPFGVYAVKVLIGDASYFGVANVGCKPTIGGDNPVGVETHIIDFNREAYGEEICVQFSERLRGEIRFDGLGQLSEQMVHDIEMVRHILQKY